MACGTLNCRFRHSCRKVNTTECIEPDCCHEFLKYEDAAWDFQSGDPDGEEDETFGEMLRELRLS